MKKIFLFFVSLFLTFLTWAQQYDNALAMRLVTQNSAAIGLTKDQLSNLKVSSTYFDDIGGMQLVYLLQSYKGLPVYNQMLVLAFKNEKLISNAGSLIPEMEKTTNNQSPSPSIMAQDAVKTAFIEAKLPAPSYLPLTSVSEDGRKLDFGKINTVTENITAELMWVPVEKGNTRSVKLAWQVQVVPAGRADWWYMQVDAVTGAVIQRVNSTVYEGKNQKSDDELLYISRPKENKVQEPLIKKENISTLTGSTPPTVTSADYKVLPFPVESPNYGAFAIVHNPWDLSGPGNNATTDGWHFDGTTNYNITRGNNTFAYLDVANINAPNATNNWPDTSTTAIPALTFTQTFDPTQQPGVTINKKIALNNLFYWDNLMHDVFYQYGFNEVAGNYQTDNLGRGGVGNDYVKAEAQDGSGTNNANFNAGGPDGGSGRMQMYLWNPAAGVTTLHVNAPAPIVGNYTAVESNFSPNNLLANVGPVTAQVIYFNDAAGGTHDACTGAPSNILTGKIALINRGTCNFTVKVLAAQAAGAVAVIMVNNVAGAPIIMGGGPDPTIVIPAVMVSDVDGATIAAQLANNVNATLSGTAASTINIDGDIDDGVVCHEFGHGISNRLTGGPATTSCLGNAEEGGEGWSDFQGLMMTTNWATALLTDGANAHPIGTYAFGQPGTGPGIRNYPYSTNIAINPLTYANMGTGTIGTEVHNIGEIWCMALWEMNWALIQQTGVINPNIFNAAGAGGNSIAMKLEIEGMKLQPCSPGFIDARNAILTADQNLYGGAHLCTIWAAFAKRGMGYSALQGSSNSATDQTAAFDLPPAPAFTAQPANTTVCAGANATFTVTATGYNLTYNWQVSTDAGVTWNSVVPAVTTATLNLTAVTAGMNNYRYRCVISGGCPNASINSTGAILTVNTSNPVITSQPANTSVCAGTDANFSITVTGNNLTYSWQVSTDGGVTWNAIVPAVTTPTLTLTAVTAGMNNYQYRCVITGGCPATNTTTSLAATLTVTTGSIAITANPANTSVCAGADASFSVTATGASLTYNWQVSTDGGVTWNNLIPAVTTPTLTLTAVTAGMNNYQYRCIVNGPGACTPAGVTSTAGVLTINNPVAITGQPANASACPGSNASFTVTATGSGLSYNWQVSTDGGVTWNSVIPAATTPTLTLTGVTAGMDNYQYRCVVSGTCNPGGVNSNAGILSVNNTPVTITTQPSDATVCAGANANFTITATGSGPIYNWQVSTDGGVTWNSLIPAVTTPTLTLTAVTAGMNNNEYRCVVSSTCNPGGINSNAATLTVNSAPAITTQPVAAAACSGGNATFCVTATGTNLTYQWQSSPTCAGPWANIPAATSSCVTVSAAVATSYQCIVSGTCTPSVTSNCASLTINTAAAITSQPANVSTCTGSDATFSVTATGTGVTYNWQVSTDGGVTWNSLVPAVTTPTLTLTAVTAGMNNNQYRCVVAGTCTAVGINSTAATLSLNNSIAITTQPSDAGGCAGTDVSFTVAGNGTGIAYNWQVSTDGGVTWNNLVPAVTTPTLTIVGATLAMSGNQYRCVVSGTCNPAGINSNAATLSVNTSVTIVDQPENVNGCINSNATFTVNATGSFITYQWQVSTDGGATYTDIPGATSSTLSLGNLTYPMSNNMYRVVVSGIPCGSVISNSVVLTVNPSPVVVLTAASYPRITPAVRTMVYTTVSPPGVYTYQWFRNGVLISNTTSSFPVDVDGLGDYTAVVTNAFGCTDTSNVVNISDSASNVLFIYPNPNSGVFQVRYYNASITPVNRTLSVYDNKGARVYQQSYTVSGFYDRMDVNLTNASSGLYLVELRDAGGKRVAVGKVLIQR